MAEKKNFTIENYNGTDYDTLYPETNSGQVLLDSDAQVELKLASGSTLDDAIHTITKEGGTFQVGDTLTTARTNLGNKWLLCNGAQVTNSSYPELAPMFESKELDFVSSGNVTLSQFPSSITYVDIVTNENASQFLFTGYNSSGNRQFLYTTNLYDASQYKTAFSDVKNGGIGDRITYQNGIWFAYGNIGSFKDRNLYYIEGDLSSTQKTPPLGTVDSYTCTLSGVPIYYQGKYYVPGDVKNLSEDKSYSKMCIYTSLDATPIIVDYQHLSNFEATVLPDGICWCYDFNGKRFNVINSDGTVTNYSYSTPSYNQIKGSSIYYMNGYYYLFISVGNNGNFTYIYRSTNLNSMSLYKSLNYAIDLTHPLQIDDKIIFKNGYYMDIDGNIKQWSKYVAAGANDYQTRVALGGGKYWRIVSDLSSVKLTPYYAQQDLSFTLPKVSVANTLYTYIKAKS